MPFGPKNAPAFYTAMIQTLRGDWLALFEETKHMIIVENVPVTTICDDKIVIYDILLYLHFFTTFFLHCYSLKKAQAVF